MMSRVALLSDSRSSTSVKFLEFTRIAAKDIVAVFFEGEDEKYYSGRINLIRSDIRWQGVKCGGKENVKNLRDKIKKHGTYKKYPCMFFVDSDFDNNHDIASLQDLYITPCYSIENLYISDNVFKRVMNAEFGLSDSAEDSEEYVNAIQKYSECKAQYLKAIADFNFFIREVRLMEKSGALDGKLNINNIDFGKLVKIECCSVHKLYSKENYPTIFSEIKDHHSVSIEGSILHFKSVSAEMWFRGKQHLEFFRTYLIKLKEDRCKKENRILFKSKGNVKLCLTKDNCISELSQYADTPDCLKDFLLKFAIEKHAA